ncbi:orotidine-5'-phosphate decarboxylase [Anoxynatronum buryatiense]|uniref:Orotidine 5'-phosphate decarboxylase n=1 Tax=Anoxynatronum buryatiense TaxID=489973 RepID=A0AA45WW52_9CLOT|nr:orotidine-5'-phosphate decarboxylase [Anoxynatronum buryatiense]SMP55420.1 orotidine-5'-phosphate decarboxylase [Anoxynatronum buryatiense]
MSSNVMNELTTKQNSAREKLIVALDKSEAGEVNQLVSALGEEIIWYKVGMELYYNEGNAMVKRLLNQGKQVFLDLKFHDIPNTVGQAARAATRLGVGMFNVHAGGGREMMRQAALCSREEAARLGLKPPVVLGVTVLTSMNQEAFETDLGFTGTIEDKVVAWAVLAQEAGLDGVVASAREAALIRKQCGAGFKIVTPGIRPAGSDLNDQARVMTPEMALDAGADYLVVGRPITAAPQPADAARSILQTMAR